MVLGDAYRLGHALSRRAAECAADKQEEEHIQEDPIWHSLTFHHLGLILSAVFGLLALMIAFYLILRHATHYLRPWEQKHIIRILFMIPIYATVSFLSYLYYRHAVYFEVIRDCYEAFAISSFFTLMCHYIAPNLHDQKEFFRNVTPKNWVWPLTWMQKCTGGEHKGPFRKPISGLTWFNIVWISIYQYCFIRPFFTVVAVTTQVLGRYCQSSLDPRFAYIWVGTFEALSVTVAMYCVIQFYVQLKDDLAAHRPFLKVLCIKLVIFFCFWQSLLISFLASERGPLKASKTIADADLRIGLPAMLICVEMTFFALLHLFAFPWKPYDLKRQTMLDSFSGEQPKGYVHGPMRALASAFNPWDIIKACGRGFRWLFWGIRKRHQDSSYQTKLDPMPANTVYHGPTFAGNGEAATEMRRKDSSRKDPFDDSDTAGLLSHAQSPSFYDRASFTQSTTYLNPDSLPSAPLTPQEYGFTHREQARPGASQQRTAPYPDGSYGLQPPQEQDLGQAHHQYDPFAGVTNPQPTHAGNEPRGTMY